MSDDNQGPFLPLLLLAIAVIGWSGFQTSQLVIERSSLREAISSQEAQMDQSARLRERLQSLANRVALLARSGNANATIVVEELRKRGITLGDQPPAPDAAAPGATPGATPGAVTPPQR